MVYQTNEHNNNDKKLNIPFVYAQIFFSLTLSANAARR